MDTFVLQVNTSTLKLQLFHSKAAVRQIEGKVMLKMETGVEKQAAAASANCWLALDPAPAAVSLSYVLKPTAQNARPHQVMISSIRPTY